MRTSMAVTCLSSSSIEIPFIFRCGSHRKMFENYQRSFYLDCARKEGRHDERARLLLTQIGIRSSHPSSIASRRLIHLNHASGGVPPPSSLCCPCTLLVRIGRANRISLIFTSPHTLPSPPLFVPEGAIHRILQLNRNISLLSVKPKLLVRANLFP